VRRTQACAILHASHATSGDSGYFLLSLMSSLVFRAVRDSVPNPVSQERLVGAVLKVLAIADVSLITSLWMRCAHELSLE
jgi:hypothetical protein